VLWLAICLVGLLAETLLIVVLGRQATGAYGALPADGAESTAPGGALTEDAVVRRRSRP
jgi:hypothetical protein